MDIKKVDGHVQTNTPYNEDWIDFARSRRAKWDKRRKVWKFKIDDYAIVKEKITEIFGPKRPTSPPRPRSGIMPAFMKHTTSQHRNE